MKEYLLIGCLIWLLPKALSNKTKNWCMRKMAPNHWAAGKVPRVEEAVNDLPLTIAMAFVFIFAWPAAVPLMAAAVVITHMGDKNFK